MAFFCTVPADGSHCENQSAIQLVRVPRFAFDSFPVHDHNIDSVLGPAWAPQDWQTDPVLAETPVVTITYSNGTVLEALVLAGDENALRVIAPGQEDVQTFTRIHGTWVSECLEPVIVEFAWHRRPAPAVPAEVDMICPTELAAQLIQSLLTGN